MVRGALTSGISDSILILGYGREGQSVFSFLRNRYPHLKISVADKVAHPSPELTQADSLYFGLDYLKHLSRYEIIVRSPGIPLQTKEILEAKSKGAQLTSATNLFFEHAPGQIVGVSGTKGKSTTASLLAAVLASKHQDVRLVGNIGTPALSGLEDATSETRFVVELSSFQLEDSHRSPEASVLLPIYPEHLDHHGSLAAYLEAKSRIYAAQQPEDLLVCHEQAATLVFGNRAPIARTLIVSSEPSPRAAAFVKNGVLYLKGEQGNLEPLVEMSSLPIIGRKNAENALLAACLGRALGISLDSCKEALLGFQGLAHRLEPLGCFKGINFVNDSLSTIPQATEHALQALGSSVQTLILGGHNRGIDYSCLCPLLAESKVETLILFPSTGEIIYEHLKEYYSPATPPQRCFFVTAMEDAVRLGYQHTSVGSTCLLSPAASSLNLFRDYQDRGDQFKAAVKKYEKVFSKPQ
jgi:UDP-N-acetylmuramoylalanine--D-glutamate ligase